MKTLFILRHAKSSWKDAHVADFQRPLNKRGRRAADLIGMLVKEKTVKPDFVLSSPAVRAAETIGIVLESARLLVELQYDDQLYLATCERLLQVVSELADDREQVLLIGHNPGLEELLHRLTGVVEHLPTAAFGKIVLDVAQWSDVAHSKCGHLEWLIRPSELGVT